LPSSNAPRSLPLLVSITGSVDARTALAAKAAPLHVEKDRARKDRRCIIELY